MKSLRAGLPIRLLPLLVLASSAPGARAETTECTVIASVPTTLSSPGVYCLKSSFSTNLATGTAIYVNANNVTLDMNGYKLGNLAAGTGTFAIGIYTGHQNVTVRNGTIRGYFYGIRLLGGGGHLVEDVRLDGNTYYGLAVGGPGNVVRRNQIVNTGGSTYYANSGATGLDSNGADARILDNEITGTTAPGPTAGSRAVYVVGEGSVISSNRISGTAAQAGGYAVGISWGFGSGLILDNSVVGVAGMAAQQYSAVSINGGNTVLCAGNRSVKFTLVTFQCQDGGGNVNVP
jgi:Right handed beta helix region